MRHKALIVALLAVSLCGCAGKMDAKRGLSEEWRLRSLEENFLNFKEGQRQQEEQGRDQQRKLMARMKAVEDSVQRMQEQLAAGGVVMPRKTSEAAPAPAAPVMAPATAPAVDGGQPEATLSEPAKTEPSPSAAAQPEAAQPTTAEAEPAAPAPSPAPASAPAPAMAKSAATGSALYHEGMTLVAADHPEQGRKLLQEFLSTEPNSVLVPNALYWLGESHYADKNYAQAILSFKEVTRRYPKHTKAAAALLKIGMSYAMLGEKDNASLYLRALLQDFPKSEPAPLARKKLAELGR